MKRALLVFLLLFAVSNKLYSQDEDSPNWMNVNFKHNFYDIQADFNKYWEGRKITPKTPRDERAGWKQFKRWEWFWEQRVTPSGVFPKPSHTMEEYLKYRASKQEGKSDRKQAGDWVHLGPSTASGGYEGLGRLNCVVEDPNYNGTTNKTIWVGAASGGIWKTTNGGASWTTNTDWFAALGIADIVINPTNPNIMYAATGDGDADDTYSIGVLKSTDAGNTWTITSLQHQVSEQKVCRRMVINPTNANILLVATNSGLFRTTNAGSTWSQVRSGGYWDVKLHPQNPNIVYAATSNVIYTSTDAGASWNSGVSITSSTRIALAVSPNQPGYVYALSANDGAYNGLWLSTNTASTFTRQSNSPNLLNSSSTGSGTGGQGWYDLSLAVDPTNASIVYVGGVNIWKSTNSGVNWSIKGYWTSLSGVATVHADHHMFYFGGTSRLYSANDGGLDVSTNGGTSWTFIGSGLKITQFYRIATSQTNAYYILGGAQDNSSFLRTANSFDMTQATGDGMDQAINPSNGNYMFTSSYYGDLYRSTNAGSSWTDLTEPNDDGGWVTPYVIDPNNHTTLVAGYTGVWKSTNNGTSWTKISTFSNSTYLTVIHVAPANSNYIYAGRSSALWKTTDGGTTWSSVTLPYSSLTSLTSNATDPNEIWITMSGYSSTNKVFKSTNGGANWTNITGSLPNVPCNHILFQPNADKRVWVATDIGVWYRGNSDLNWMDYNDYLPNVICNDLEIYAAGNKLRLGTYGRGVWEATLPTVANLPPNLLYPANNADSIPTQVNLQWYASFGATSYRLQVSNSSNFNNLLVNTITTATNFTVSNLQYGTQYYWRLRSRNATDSSDWSEVWSFKTKLPIYPPNIISPDDGINTQANSIAFIWHAEPNATNYRLQVSRDSLFSNIVVNQQTADTSYNWNSLIKSSRLFWRVQSSNATYTSDWSSVRVLTTFPIVEITLGTGSATSDLPYHTYYADATTYLLFTASEIKSAGGGSGLITSLAFNVVSPSSSFPSLNGFTIFMQNTTASSITAPITTGWTQVYSTSAYVVSQTGWSVHSFSTPFAYDSTKNLLIKVCFNNPDYTWTSNSTVTATSASGKIYARRSDTSPNTCQVDPTSTYSTTNRPNVKLVMMPPLLPPEMVSPLNNDTFDNDKIAFKWRRANTASAYQVIVSDAAGDIVNAITADTILQPQPLGSEGTYSWKVRSINGGDSSAWVIATFYVTRVSATHSILLHNGWNMISTYVEPDSTSIEALTSGITNSFSIIKSMSGDLYSPPIVNTLQNWNIRQAYQIKMNAPRVLSISGLRIVPNSTPIIMNKLEWFWMPYFRVSSMATASALSSISGKYLQVKSIEGLVYQPPFFNTLQNLGPSKGYMIRISSPGAILLYPANSTIKASEAGNSVTPEPKFFVRDKVITGKTAVIALDISDIEYGDEIGAFTKDGLLVGASVWSENSKGVVIFGDDELTQDKDGAYEGEEITLKVWKSRANKVHLLRKNKLADMTGDNTFIDLSYETDAIYYVDADVESKPESSIFVSPQPASNSLFLKLNDFSGKAITIKIYDYRGVEAFSKVCEAGSSQLTLDISSLASGVYQLVVLADDNLYREKIVVAK